MKENQSLQGSVVLGIDVGGSTTKIVGIKHHEDGSCTLTQLRTDWLFRIFAVL